MATHREKKTYSFEFSLSYWSSLINVFFKAESRKLSMPLACLEINTYKHTEKRGEFFGGGPTLEVHPFCGKLEHQRTFFLRKIERHSLKISSLMAKWTLLNQAYGRNIKVSDFHVSRATKGPVASQPKNHDACEVSCGPRWPLGFECRSTHAFFLRYQRSKEICIDIQPGQSLGEHITRGPSCGGL